MKNIKLSLLSVTLVLSAIFVTSCSTSGPSFTQVTPPAGKGVVYIYRQSSMLGCGVFGTAKVNGRPVTKIKNGGYYPYIASPGNNHFEISAVTTDEADVMVEKGSQKYLKTTVGMGVLFAELKFTEVSPEIGKNEISGCALLKPIHP